MATALIATSPAQPGRGREHAGRGYHREEVRSYRDLKQPLPPASSSSLATADR